MSGEAKQTGLETSDSPKKRRPLWPVGLIALGVVIIAFTVTWTLNAWVFTQHSRIAGRSLLHQASLRHTQAKSSGTCQSSGSSDAIGILKIPAIGLAAPVEEGLSDAVLSVAVGHNPQSVWPGTAGTSVLAAHDVSYFVNIGQLHAGALLSYETPCVTYDYVVTAQKIVTAGAPVFNTPQSSIVLVTCWPTNALWFTPDRLLVTASETKVVQTVASPSARSSRLESSSPVIDAPPALVGQGLTLATNSIPMGRMSIEGSPDKNWIQSPEPLNVEGSAVEGFIGGLKALRSGQLSWWHSLAPGVAAPPQLLQSTVSNFKSPLNVAVQVSGTTAQTVILTTTAGVSGGSTPGTYSMTIREVVNGKRLQISNWELRRVP